MPEHSTFSKNRDVFETVLQRCISDGLVGGEGFAIDVSVVKADASHVSGI